MKIHVPELLVLFYAIGCVSAFGEPLEMKWGLENTNYFKEFSVTNGGKSTTPSKEVRGFGVNDRFNKEFSTQVLPRLFRAQERFKQVHRRNGGGLAFKPKSEFTFDKHGYSQFLKQQDPFTLGKLREMAPTLYFDFIGSKSKEYVLEQIEVQTIGFEEYKGGGFSDREAWYDIELKHKIGTATYRIDDGKLRFDGSGRTLLRFWSDNYDKELGMTPMGSFSIEVIFQFVVEGKRVKVSTGRFIIDV